MEGISKVDIINLGKLLRSKGGIDITKDQEKKREGYMDLTKMC